jgi:signal transduction histidine kinase
LAFRIGKSRSFSSIRTRLTLSHLAVIVAAMGLSGLLLLSLLEDYFLKAMEDSLLGQARITAQALLPGAIADPGGPQLPPSAFNALQQQAANFSLETQNVAAPPAGESQAGASLEYLSNSSLQLNSQLDTRIRILDPSGAVVVDSAPAGTSTGAADPLVAAALAGQTVSRVEGVGREAVMSLALPWMAGGRIIGIVYLSQPLRDVAAVLHDLRIRWLLATLLALILSAGAGLLLAGAITRPLRRLTAAAGDVAQGRLDLRVPVRSRDELGRLSQAFNDMTERLRDSRQAQTDLVANVSHELRTPLTTVKGMVETLRDGAVEDPNVRDRFLETVNRETDRMIRLVNDLLLLSRADSGALALHREDVDLCRLVEAAVEGLRPSAEDQGVSLGIEGMPGSLFVQADPGRVEQVLLNLLDNACKYSGPHSHVTVRAEPVEGHMARVQVQDDGVGIPAEVLGRMGERFFRADRARSRDEGGSGLGLAIARALVEAHGGELTLASREGQGVTAAFTLPLARPA